MNSRFARLLALFVLPLAGYAQTVQSPSELKREVEDLFTTSCTSCHNAQQAAGKLRLDTMQGVVAGGATGAAIVPGQSERSSLYQRVTAPDRTLRMPPTGSSLPASKIAALKAWIDAGAEGLSAKDVAEHMPIDFRRDVEPILKASCYGCHSGTRPKSQLRLDARAAAMKGGIGGQVIVPGRSDASRLIHRVQGAGGEPRMPLDRAPLNVKDIALLKRWIDTDASWPANQAEDVTAVVEKHWAYRAPVRPPVPNVKGQVRNPIDNFILAKLESQGMKQSPEAVKEKLIRRVSLDLIGLPPSPEEVDDFVRDTRPDAHERVVERLLASPHYGERWTRPWLDYARYADTNGYEADFRRTMWKYRDWVINALNDDMPFDRFTIEQIAGDMLPNASVQQKIATGFHRNTMYNEEGGVDKDEAYFEVLVDRVSTTTSVWLGSTIGCSQCHNHKYDPFTQREYYQMMAFFSNAAKKPVMNGGSSSKYEEAKLDLPSPDQEQQRASIKTRVDAIETKLKTSTPELESEQKNWEKKVLGSTADWVLLKPGKVATTGGSVLQAETDGTVFVSGANPQAETYIVEGMIEASQLAGIRLETLPDSRLPKGGPGRDVYGNFVLTGFKVEIGDGSTWRPVQIDRTLVDDGRVKDKRTGQLWTIDASREEKRFPRQLILTLARPLDLQEGTRIRVTLNQNSNLVGQAIGRFRLSTTNADDPTWVVKIQPKLRGVLEADPSRRTPDESKRLDEFYRTIAPSLANDRDELKELKEQRDKLGITTALIMQEQEAVERPFDFVRTRGAFSAKTDKVYAGIPAVLGSPVSNDPPNRLGLARWLVSRDNPLTARVAVNRIWEQYFGRGIVETSEDFGSQGQPPSHPELLDWLAVEFMERRWSMKALHRLITTSAAYRQSSTVTPESLRLDPYNKLLSRGPRFRLEAEMIRDVSLAASGLLSRKVGGPSVFPPQPPGVWDLPYNDDSWKESEGEDKYRRGVYTFVRRSAFYPAMGNFDAASREACTIRRIRTNTPLQALTTLNDPAFFEAAQALGGRLIREGGATDRERIDYGFRLSVGRPAKPSEIDNLLQWKDREHQYFSLHEAEAEALTPAASNPSEQAVWTMLGNILLNLDEALTKE